LILGSLKGIVILDEIQEMPELFRVLRVLADRPKNKARFLILTLLNLPDLHSLLGHPRVGASWEGFALEQTLQLIKPPQAFFWATHGGAAIDLFLRYRGRKFGIEFKFSEAPKVTKSMHTALEVLKLNHLWLIYPGQHAYPVDEKISALPLKDIGSLSKEMR
jgi:predicted AAA+ superfamily ATPase